MGVMYVTMLLDDQVKTWLRNEGVTFPETGAPGRWPTMKELRATLDSLEGYSSDYRRNSEDGWDITIVDRGRGYDGWSASIWTKHVPDEDAPTEFSFHRPNMELAILVLRALVPVCGPFVLVDDASVTPVVVDG